MPDKESLYIIRVVHSGPEAPPRRGENLLNGGTVRDVFPISLDDLPEEMRRQITNGEITTQDGTEAFLRKRAENPDDPLGRMAADLIQHGGSASLAEMAQRTGDPVSAIGLIGKILPGVFELEEGIIRSPFLTPAEQRSPTQ